MADYLDVWARSFQLAGTLDRKGYWTAFLGHLLAVAFFNALDILFGLFPVGPHLLLGWLGLIYLIAQVPASVTSTVRRLRDAEFSGWWVLLSLVPYLGTPIVMVLCCFKSSAASGSSDRQRSVVVPQYATLKRGRLDLSNTSKGDQ